jgi:protein-disulfide isomerase
VPGYVFTLSTLGLAAVLYLAWASYFVLKVFCILCAITYVAVIALFIVSGGATKFPMTTLPRRAARDLRAVLVSPLALLIAAIVVGGGATLLAVFPREPVVAQAPAPVDFPPLTDAERAQFTAWWDAQEKVDVPLTSNAKVLIVKFNDFQCPPCRLTHMEYKGILAKYEASGDVQFVLKHYPLDPECNANVPGGQHMAACEAAAAVVMARSKGTVAKLEDWFFDNQATLTPAVVRQAARDVGGITDFDAQYQRALQEVKADAGLGALLGVRSTPTFFINGHRIVGGQQPRALDAAIQLEIERAKSRTK